MTYSGDVYPRLWLHCSERWLRMPIPLHTATYGSATIYVEFVRVRFAQKRRSSSVFVTRYWNVKTIGALSGMTHVCQVFDNEQDRDRKALECHLLRKGRHSDE